MKKLHPHTAGIYEIFQVAANPEKAKPMEKYMRNHFTFFGITSPERKQLSADYLKKNNITDGEELKKIVLQLWKLPERECQYHALDLLTRKFKLLGIEDGAFLEYLVVNKSWWDTVDALASNVAGPWLRNHPSKIKSITIQWNHSDNFWLQRMSLLFQLKYKTSTDLQLMQKYILHLSSSKEFFIRKAIGWILREYSKTDAGFVKNFVARHDLSPLSQREALKVINRNGY